MRIDISSFQQTALDIFHVSIPALRSVKVNDEQVWRELNGLWCDWCKTDSNIKAKETMEKRQ